MFSKKKETLSAPTIKTATVATHSKPIFSSTDSTATASTVTIGTSCPRVHTKDTSTMKERNMVSRPKINKNMSVLADDVLDTTVSSQDPEFEGEYRQIAYGKFIRSMLEDCLVDEKTQRETTEIDEQMTHLAKRFQKTIEQLDKTNRRIQEISFVAEQQRLVDLKKQDCSKFYEITDDSNSKELLKNLNRTQEESLDRLQTKNVDFGYNKESGHRQLLDAVNDAITGLDNIKKHSLLDTKKFKTYEQTDIHLDNVEKNQMSMENIKKDFEKKFPELNEKLLQELSETVSKIMESGDD